MKIDRRERSLIAWTLYASVLFSLLVCGIHHGQMSGLALSGLQGGYCALDSEHGHAFDAQPSNPTQPALLSFDCPLCSSGGLGLALQQAAWDFTRMPGKALAPMVLRSLAQPPPRERWTSLNPRASPVALNTLA
ncbi:DUF2946 domain-containing protein [Pseudomonas sp. DTU_2021_1001937_2_SI_NGA_ILE_001]|uniref:DUF2946 domain-containing protein n=1 Tax=Pseudomonas sp. DTU_2021_1001937_2_SI_NGA_ILE_001 TaxID=3077589 RepID=UPI0028FC27DD|nr:DUF2946 domain-containing protein [Pseudomonas sp. DTU_2021_1001937_2_SI_NGA_ILE_001]WNW11616.1 DUF2946 domain-containing protein [Pseudomonas sp. DTU_2021_1001937_2_SI_NGA_ILE_001]